VINVEAPSRKLEDSPVFEDPTSKHPFEVLTGQSLAPSTQLEWGAGCPFSRDPLEQHCIWLDLREPVIFGGQQGKPDGAMRV
jgi:hypothetical protein